MDVFECIRSRRSVRRYDTDQPVSDEDLRAVLEAASWAPSGGNAQPWHFYVVRRPALLDRMRQIVRDVAGHIERIATYGTFFHAPCVIGVCVDVNRRDYHIKDPEQIHSLDDVYGNPDFLSVAAATQNLVLAAHARGLGACWCRVSPFYRRKLEAVLETAPHHRLIVAVTVGHPGEAPPPSSRKPLDDVCTLLND